MPPDIKSTYNTYYVGISQIRKNAGSSAPGSSNLHFTFNLTIHHPIEYVYFKYYLLLFMVYLATKYWSIS